MIIKTVAKKKKPNDKDIFSLTDYLTDSKIDKRIDRIDEFFSINCVKDAPAETAEDVIACSYDMFHIAKRNQRSQTSKYKHLTISLADGEDLSLEQFKEIASEILKDFKMEGHQLFAIKHSDNGRPHFHFVINKVNPTNYNCITTYRDHLILREICNRFEERFDLQKTNKKTSYQDSKLSSVTAQFERTGTKSLLEYVLDIKDDLDQSSSWEEFHQKLSENNLIIKQRGNGLVIQDNNTKDCIKCSSVDRLFSLKNLEKKLGKYEASVLSIAPKKSYSKKKNQFKPKAFIKSEVIEKLNSIKSQLLETSNRKAFIDLLVSNGIEWVQRGRYKVFASQGITVKPSLIDRNLSEVKLEKKWKSNEKTFHIGSGFFTTNTIKTESTSKTHSVGTDEGMVATIMNSVSNGDLITSTKAFEDFCRQHEVESKIHIFKKYGLDREGLDMLIKSYLAENAIDTVDEIITSLKENGEFDTYKATSTLNYVKNFDEINKVKSDKSKVEENIVKKAKRGKSF